MHHGSTTKLALLPSTSGTLGDGGGRLIPYLLGFESPGDLKEPLAQFNASLADKDGTWNVVKTLNNHAEFKQDEPALQEAFDLWWPKLNARLEAAAKLTRAAPKAERSDKDKLDEVLSLVREVSRSPVLSEQFATLLSAFAGLSSGRAERASLSRRLGELSDDLRPTEKGLRVGNPKLHDEMDRSEMSVRASTITRRITGKRSDALLVNGDIHDDMDNPLIVRIVPPVDPETANRIDREFRLNFGTAVLILND
jgi:hypothetical protein